MPTRPNFNHSSAPHSFNSANNSNQIPTMIPSSTSNVDLTSYIGKTLIINQHQVIVEDILGQGGFAYVFLVRSSNQQRYALKRMYVNNEHDLLVCQQEISILKEFSTHGQIVKYIDSSIQRVTPSSNIKRHGHQEKTTIETDDQEEDAIYEILLLTEYCAHGALVTRLNEQRSNNNPPVERQILRIFADICLAVSGCHHRRPQPILHRDIKLENILIDSHQSFVLCDFGSAIFLPPSPTNEHQQYQVSQLTTSVIQHLEEEIQRYTTLSYRAPEMIDLYSRKPITLKTDIWAMGCLLYKLMYNVMPFGDSILAIQNGTFTLPDEMAQAYSRELNLLLRFILEIDIHKRPDIWQVSYLTFKLLGIECPVPNRCNSKIPDLSGTPMPLTESESRHQRAMTLAAAKTTSKNALDETHQVGTAVNPRERPRGIMAPSGSFMNFNQSAQRPIALAVPPPLPPPTTTTVSTPNRSTTQQRPGSTAQSMFDDDFSQYPSHALSLTNITNTNATPLTPKVSSTATPDRNVSRARPSPPSSISAASGLAIHKQLFPPPPLSGTTTSVSSPSQVHQHRRSASQTMSPPNNMSSTSNTLSVESMTSFDNRRHSIDSTTKSEPQAQVLVMSEASDDDEDGNTFATNLSKLKVHNHSTENVKSRESLILNEDDRLFTKTYMAHTQLKSDDEQSSSSSSSDEHEKTVRRKSKKKSQLPSTPLRTSHHGAFDELDKPSSSPVTNNNKNLVKRLIERCSLQQNEEPTASSTPAKRKDSFTLAHEHPIPMGDRNKVDSEADSNDDDENDDDRLENNPNHNKDKVGFDQLINEDSDDEEQQPQSTGATSKNAPTTTGLFHGSRMKEQQYEHFEDSDDDNSDDDTKSLAAKSNSNATTKLFHIFTSNAKTNAYNDTKRIVNEQNNQNYYPSTTTYDYDNPFLQAPFHHSHKTHSSTQASSSSSINADSNSSSSFDPTSIVVGKRLSAFAPYQRQDPSGNATVVDSTVSAFSLNSMSKQKLPHSESYPPGNNSNPGNTTASISKDVFINAPFKTKITQKPTNSTTSSKLNTISPSSSQSTSSSNSQLIDLSTPCQQVVETTTRRATGSAALATQFSTLANPSSSNENTYYFHPDEHSSNEELISSRKRSSKKKSLLNNSSSDYQEQHAYSNLSFNDAIVDEFL